MQKYESHVAGLKHPVCVEFSLYTLIRTIIIFSLNLKNNFYVLTYFPN
jgi:hypothetical protein